jgi:hypothetical protein
MNNPRNLSLRLILIFNRMIQNVFIVMFTLTRRVSSLPTELHYCGAGFSPPTTPTTHTRYGGLKPAPHGETPKTALFSLFNGGF